MLPVRNSFLVALIVAAQCLLVSQTHSATEDYVTLKTPNEIKPFLLSDQYNQAFNTWIWLSETPALKYIFISKAATNTPSEIILIIELQSSN